MTAHDDKCLSLYEKLRPFLVVGYRHGNGEITMRWDPTGKHALYHREQDGTWSIARPTFSDFCRAYNIPPIGTPREVTSGT